MRARGARLHAIQELVGKRKKQEFASGGFVDATRAEIEEGAFVNLADGCAVCAFHVVGVNLKLRFGVDLGAVGKQKIAIGLLGVGFLRVFVNDDAAVEDTVSATSTYRPASRRRTEDVVGHRC